MRALLEQLITRRRSLSTGLFTIALLAGTFCIDLFTQEGIAVWPAYVLAVVVAMEWHGRWIALVVAGSAVGLTSLGAWLSPPGHPDIDLGNRILAVMTIGAVYAWLAYKEIAQQRAEAFWRQSEITLQSVIQSAADAIILADADGKIISCNRAACSIFGYRKRDVVGRSLTMLIPERYREAHQRGLERVRATGESRLVGKTIELHGLRQGGSEFPIDLSLASWKAMGKTYYSGIIRDISLRKREENHLAAQYTVVRALAESSTLTEASPKILQAVCEIIGWELGAIWIVDGEAGVLRCIDVWHMPSLEAGRFCAVTRDTTFARDVGLPGRVWSSGKPAWIKDVTQDENFPRIAVARETGLHGAFAFPILAGDEMAGAIEFFSRWVRKPDENLLLMMGALGGQIGMFLSRKRMEEERARLVVELRDAMANIKSLRGLLPICASCKKIRDDSGAWNRIEDYIKERSEARFTHGICPECARQVHPDWDEG